MPNLELKILSNVNKQNQIMPISIEERKGLRKLMYWTDKDWAIANVTLLEQWLINKEHYYRYFNNFKKITIFSLYNFSFRNRVYLNNTGFRNFWEKWKWSVYMLIVK